MKTMLRTCAGALLALASLAANASEPLAIQHDELPQYWTPVNSTIVTRLPERELLARGKQRPMASSVTLTTVIDADGKVREVKVVEAVPARSSPAWAVAAMKEFAYAPALGNVGRTPVMWTQSISLLKGPPVADKPDRRAAQP